MGATDQVGQSTRSIRVQPGCTGARRYRPGAPRLNRRWDLPSAGCNRPGWTVDTKYHLGATRLNRCSEVSSGCYQAEPGRTRYHPGATRTWLEGPGTPGWTGNEINHPRTKSWRQALGGNIISVPPRWEVPSGCRQAGQGLGFNIWVEPGWTGAGIYHLGGTRMDRRSE